MVAVEYKTNKVSLFDDAHPVLLKKQWFTQFTLFSVSPVLSNNLAVLGELEKIVPMSKQRIGAVYLND